MGTPDLSGAVDLGANSDIEKLKTFAVHAMQRLARLDSAMTEVVQSLVAAGILTPPDVEEAIEE